MNQHIRAAANASFAATPHERGGIPDIMNVSVVMHNEICIVSILGDLNSRFAGEVYDTLVQCIIENRNDLIVDMSGVTDITRAGTRGLIVATRLMQNRRGGMRVCGASSQVDSTLHGFEHRFKFDLTLAKSIDALAGAAMSQTISQTRVAETPKGPQAGYSRFLELVSHRRR